MGLWATSAPPTFRHCLEEQLPSFQLEPGMPGFTARPSTYVLYDRGEARPFPWASAFSPVKWESPSGWPSARLDESSELRMSFLFFSPKSRHRICPHHSHLLSHLLHRTSRAPSLFRKVSDPACFLSLRGPPAETLPKQRAPPPGSPPPLPHNCGPPAVHGGHAGHGREPFSPL